ncbi:hypothetical protein EC991_000745 [Linnemannia zychae]|nr:hypothetical protein EC991_000745 [Linnemannia zychae]
MMVPHPLCPECYSEFVEKIEEDNDPRSFVEAGHEQGEDDDEDGHEEQEAVGLEDLLRVIHLLSNVPRTPNQHQRQQGQLPGGYPVGSGTGTTTSPFSLFNSQAHRGSTTAGARNEGSAPVSEDEEMLEVVQDTEPPQQPQGPPTSISSLLERIGLELQFMNEGGQPGGFGGFGGLFNMVGNPGDYVFGQGGLDDVITQMMELQSRQNGPVALSEEAINELPFHTLTLEELGMYSLSIILHSCNRSSFGSILILQRYII